MESSRRCADDASKATHGRDIQERARVFYEDSGALGRGGKVRMTPNREVAEDSRRTVVEFFVQHLRAP